MQKIGDTYIPGKDYENDIYVVSIGNTSSRYTKSVNLAILFFVILFCIFIFKQ